MAVAKKKKAKKAGDEAGEGVDPIYSSRITVTEVCGTLAMAVRAARDALKILSVLEPIPLVQDELDRLSSPDIERALAAVDQYDGIELALDRGPGIERVCEMLVPQKSGKRYLADPVLSAVTGISYGTWREHVAATWAYIKRENLQDPVNKRTILCDVPFMRVSGGALSTTMLDLPGLLTRHLTEVK